MPTRIIECLIIFLLLAPMVRGQATAKQEAYRFYHTLDSLLSNTPDGPCKTAMAKYRKSIADAKFDGLPNAVAQFLAAGDSFQLKPGKSCTKMETVIKEANTSLKQKFARLSSRTDSSALLNQLRYLQYKIWGYLEIGLHVTGKAGRPVVPSITISPSLPFLLDKNPEDTTAQQLFLFPGSSLDIIIAAEGYTTRTQRMDSLASDTSFTILLESTTIPPTQNDRGKKEEIPVKSNPYKWISFILGAVVLLLLGRQLLTKRKVNTTDSSPPATAGTAPTSTPIITMKQFINPARENAYFLAEIMMTAGPRKSSGTPDPDRDLGEDVCGFVNNSDKMLMWVLDGASDYFSERNPDTGQEYFSSRLLAQSIAGKLKQQFAAINATSFQEIVTGIIESVKTDWISVIRSLPPGETDALRKSVTDGRFPECAATILIAKLSLSGELEVYRSGDCKLFYYREEAGLLKYVPSSLSAKNSKSNDWLFFRMVETDGMLDIIHNTPLFEVLSETGIQTIIGVSDGIGSETIETLSKDQPQDKELFRRKLIQQVQGTGDDKSLCMIEIKKEALSYL